MKRFFNKKSSLLFWLRPKFLVLAIFGLVFIFSNFLSDRPAEAAVAQLLNYQAKVLDSSGIPVSDGSYDVVFRICAASDCSGGSDPLWTETWNAGTSQVTVSDGLFSVLLGTHTALNLDFNSSSYYLGVNFNGDGEMTPRKRVAGAAWSLNSNLLDGLDTDNDGATSAYVVAANSSGNVVVTGTPLGTGVNNGPLYINPASASANYTVFGVAVGGVEKFRVDEDGDTSVTGLITVADGGGYTQTSTATSGNEFAITATPGSNRTSAVVKIDGAGTNWGDANVVEIDKGGSDSTLYQLQLSTGGVGQNRFFSNSVSSLTIEHLLDVASGDAFIFTRGWGSSVGLTSSSAEQAFFNIAGLVNQSGTAAYNIAEITWTETASGSGDHRGLYMNAPTGFTGNLMKLDVDGSEKFYIDQDGVIVAYSDGWFYGSVYAAGSVNWGNGGGQLLASSDDGEILSIGSVDGVSNRHFIFTDYSNRSKDHDHDTLSTNPTVFIHSVLDPDTSNNQWGSFSHNQENFVITTGANEGTGTGATTDNNGVLIAPSEMTSGGTADYALSVTRTLNDSGAAGGSDLFTGFLMDITPTDVTGWDTINLMDLKYNNSSKFIVDNSGNTTIAGALGLDTLDLTPSSNVDAIDVTGTNMTTAAVLDANLSAMVSGSVLDLDLDISTIQANTAILDILDSRNHDDGAGDTYDGIKIAMSGNFPGTNSSVTKLINVDYSGTLGANDANASLYGVYSDISGTLTAGTYAAGYFTDGTRAVSFADGTNAITVADGGGYSHTSTATSGNEFAITASPNAGTRTDPIMSITAAGANWGAADVVVIDTSADNSANGLKHVKYPGGGKYETYWNDTTEQMRIFGTWDAVSGTPAGINFTFRSDVPINDAFFFNHSSGGLISTDDEQSFFHMDGDIAQGGTASYNAFELTWTENSSGSGAHRGLYMNAPSGFSGDLIKLDVDGSEKFAVDDGGSITSTLGATNKVFIDATTNTHTNTSGVIDMDIRAGAAGVSGIYMDIDSQGDYDAIFGSRMDISSGGMVPTAGVKFTMGQGIYMNDNPSDAYGGGGSIPSMIIGDFYTSETASSGSGTDWYGNWVLFEDSKNAYSSYIDSGDMVTTGNTYGYAANIGIDGTGNGYGFFAEIINDSDGSDATNLAGGFIRIDPERAGSDSYGLIIQEADIDSDSNEGTLDYGLYLIGDMTYGMSLSGNITTDISLQNSETIVNSVDNQIAFSDTSETFTMNFDADTSTAIDLTTNGSIDLTLNPGGNLGIGTVAPSQFVEVELDASDRIFINATTNAHTGTSGVLDLDMRAGAEVVSGIYVDAISTGDYSDVYGTRVDLATGGMVPSAAAKFNAGSAVFLSDNASDAADSYGNPLLFGDIVISDSSSSSSSADWYGQAVFWTAELNAYFDNLAIADIATQGDVSMFYGDLRFIGNGTSTGDIGGITLTLKNTTNAAETIYGSDISIVSDQDNGSGIVGHYLEFEISGSPASSYGLYIDSSAGNALTADMRLQNGETIFNSTDSQITFGEDDSGNTQQMIMDLDTTNAVTLTASAGDALKLTSPVGTTWSTTAGQLTLQGAAGLYVDSNGGNLVLDAATGYTAAVALGDNAGDDFYIDAGWVFTVSSDTDNIGIGLAAPDANKKVHLYVPTTDASHPTGLYVDQSYNGLSSGTASYGIYASLSNNATDGSAAIHAQTTGSTSKPLVAVSASTSSSQGSAVSASATHGTGVTFGIQSHTYSQNGYAGFFRCIDDTTINGDDCSGIAVHAAVDGEGTGVTASSGLASKRDNVGDGDAIHAVSEWRSGTGVVGTSAGTSGYGVQGFATASSGTTYGVYGSVNSSSGWGGYFTGGNGLYSGSGLTVVGLTSTSSYNLVRVNTADGKFYYDSSSKRYKENIEVFEEDFSKILEIDPKIYIDKESGEEEIGLIAEELHDQGLTHLVIYKDGVPDAIKYDRVSLYLLGVLKDHQTILDQLDVGDSVNFSSDGISLDDLNEIIADKWSIDENGVLKTEINTESGEKKEVFAISSTEVEITLSGSSQLEKGVKEIKFEDVDPEFTKIISSKVDLKIIITPTGQCKGIYVAQKLKELSPDGNSTKHIGFKVKELDNGDSDATFDWMVVGRRIGYVNFEESGCDETHLENCNTVELCQQLPDYYWDGQCHIVGDTNNTGDTGDSTDNTGTDYGDETENSGTDYGDTTGDATENSGT